MARYDTRIQKLFETQHIQPQLPSGEMLDSVVACDTDEGWVEEWQTYRGPDGKLRFVTTPWEKSEGKISRKVADPIKRYIDFDLIDKRTGKLLHAVRHATRNQP